MQAETELKRDAENNGREAAFTRPSTDNNFSSEGLTKREYFAAMAMQALLSAKGYVSSSEIASDAVDYADALLLELEKSQQQ